MTIEVAKLLDATYYVQKNCACLEWSFLKPSGFNATKFLNPRHHLSDDGDHITDIELWLKIILLKFQYNVKENEMCKGEILKSTPPCKEEPKTHN